MCISTFNASSSYPSEHSKYDSVMDSYEEQEFWMTRLDWVGIWLNHFEMFEEHENCLSKSQLNLV